MSGPWPAGSFSDIRIFRQGLRNYLNDNEFVIADKGYPDSRCLQPPGITHPQHSLYRVVRSRHEIMNKRIKQFKVLNTRFRHSISYHGTCFHAVSNITAIALDEHPLFSIL